MRRALWVVALVAGCGGRVVDGAAGGDAGTDAFVADVARDDTRPPPFDSGRDTRPIVDPPPSCDTSIDGFACTPAADAPGKTVCTDAMIEEFLSCFGPSSDEKRCLAARKTYPGCDTCMLSDWLKINPDTGRGTINIAACIKKIDPVSKCSGAVNCAVDCEDWVCAECDDTPGSGKTGSSSSSERLECERDAQSPGTTTRPKGACYELAYKDYVDCESDPRFRYCFVRTTEDLRYFYRGACRDGGSWSSVTIEKPTPVDAGTSG